MMFHAGPIMGAGTHVGGVGAGASGSSFGHLLHPLKAMQMGAGPSPLVRAVMGGSDLGAAHQASMVNPSVNTGYAMMQKKQAPPY